MGNWMMQIKLLAKTWIAKKLQAQNDSQIR